MRNLARRLDRQAPGVAASILEGLDEILTVDPPRSPARSSEPLARRWHQLDREHDQETVRRVCRDVKRWRNAAMALRWTLGMMEAAKGLRRLKAWRTCRSSGPRLSLSALEAARVTNEDLNRKPTPHSMINGDACFAYFNKIGSIPEAPMSVAELYHFESDYKSYCQACYGDR